MTNGDNKKWVRLLIGSVLGALVAFAAYALFGLNLWSVAGLGTLIIGGLCTAGALAAIWRLTEL